MGNRWKEIWNKKGLDFDWQEMRKTGDEYAVYTALKKLDGYDVSVKEAEAYYRCFYNAAVNTWEFMIHNMQISSAYEVGCGSGANLYLMKNRGIQTSGIDYSDNLVKVAKNVLGEESRIENGEAIHVSTNDRYDMVFSEGVFAYFPDEAYGEAVLEKMFDKARKVVIIREVFDKALESACERHRREMIPDYDEKYKGLGRTSYEREMFRRFADKHHCQVEFSRVENEYYWNSPYLYHCCITKI